MEIGKIHLSVAATDQNFEEAGYLNANPDVAEAVRQGHFPCGQAHFERYGKREGRKIALANSEAQIQEMRAQKLDMLGPNFKHDMACTYFEGRPNYLTPDLIELSGISATTNVSSNSYDGDLWNLIEQSHDGIILDCGAGRRDIYLSNVVCYEIVPYDTTDVLGIGEALPFLDNTFDGVISTAVLEHVKYPFQCAAEICRVLKPGGWLFCNVPFLQPYHGYPHHYFNMTHHGMRVLFESSIEINRQYVNRGMSPIWALNWIVKSWAAGLPSDLAETFLDLRLRDVALPPLSLIDEPYVVALQEDKNLELACATILIGRKRK